LVTAFTESAFLKHVCEGKREERIEEKRRRGRKRKHRLDDLEEKREYWNSGNGER
jgi:hypothetical protein